MSKYFYNKNEVKLIIKILNYFKIGIRIFCLSNDLKVSLGWDNVFCYLFTVAMVVTPRLSPKSSFQVEIFLIKIRFYESHVSNAVYTVVDGTELIRKYIHVLHVSAVIRRALR